MQEYRQHRFERPEGATEILLVRHGESRPATAEAPFPLVDGHGDPELAEAGRVQAKKVGAYLKDLPITTVYVTNLRRTVETAAPLCRHLGIEPRVEADLREVCLGDWEGGLLRIKAYQKDPLYLQMQKEQRWDLIPGAESMEALQARVSRGIERIVSRHPGELVVALLHGGVIGHLLAQATGAEPFAFNGCDNGSISRIVVTQGVTLVRGFNDVTHLGGYAADGAPLSFSGLPRESSH